MKTVRDLRLLAEQHKEWSIDNVKMVLWIMFCVGNLDHCIINDELFEKTIDFMSHKKKESE